MPVSGCCSRGKAPLPDELRAALGLTSDAEDEEVADIDADVGRDAIRGLATATGPVAARHRPLRS